MYFYAIQIIYSSCLWKALSIISSCLLYHFQVCSGNSNDLEDGSNFSNGSLYLANEYPYPSLFHKSGVAGYDNPPIISQLKNNNGPFTNQLPINIRVLTRPKKRRKHHRSHRRQKMRQQMKRRRFQNLYGRNIAMYANQNSFPFPAKQGTLTNDSVLGRIFKVPESTPGKYEAIFIDMQAATEASTTTTSKAPSISTTANTQKSSTTATSTNSTVTTASTTPPTIRVSTTTTDYGTATPCNRPQVTTDKGIYRGGIIDLNPGEVYYFYGIPYAYPPKDSRRFARPFDPDPITGIYEAVEIKPPCFPTRQDRASMSASYPTLKTDPSKLRLAEEDCLYLNIWLPDIATSQTDLATLVWIHGEGFLGGMNEEDYITIAHFVHKTKIIVISFQYRLGAFGFLFANDEIAPGNQGLADQIWALAWIQSNIEYFAGNKENITIMGHDIGASFVGMHLLSPNSSSFFTRAVMLGGAPTQPHVFQLKENALNVSKAYADALGCPSQNPSDYECLKRLAAMSLWDIQNLFTDTMTLEFRIRANFASAYSFVPTNVGTILGSPPVTLLQDLRQKKSTQVMIGVTANEGSYEALRRIDGMKIDEATVVSYDKFKTVVKHIFKHFSEVQISAILQEYKEWRNSNHNYQITLTELLGDYFITCPVRHYADLWSTGGLPTYFYVFSQISTAFKALNRADWMGAVHGDEIDFYFGVPLVYRDKFTQPELDLSNRMVKVLENFIKTGHPGIPWEKYQFQTPKFLELTSHPLPSLSDSLGPRKRTCGFWNELFPILGKT